MSNAGKMGKMAIFPGKMGNCTGKMGEMGKMGGISENDQGKVEKHTGENMFSSIPADGSWMSPDRTCCIAFYTCAGPRTYQNHKEYGITYTFSFFWHFVSKMQEKNGKDEVLS